jgi:hypothetical protein
MDTRSHRVEWKATVRVRRSIGPIILAMVVVTGCATLPPAQPAADVKQVVGQWEGTGTSGAGTFPVKLAVRPDGTYEAFTPSRFTGTVTVADKSFRWRSAETARTGTWTLHEGDGRRVLIMKTDDGAITWNLTPVRP